MSYSTRKISEIDATILKALLKDGRKDFLKIAEEIGISKNTIWKHFREMQRAGIVVGATAHVNHEHLGLQAIAEVHVTNYSMDRIQLHRQLKKVAGDLPILDNPLQGSCIIFAAMKNLGELEKLKEAIGKLSFGRRNTYLWTPAIKNVPENLSFGFPFNFEAKAPEESNPNGRAKSDVDVTDRRIIDKLLQNGRLPFRRIAEEIEVTTDTVARRYKRLRENGTVKPVIQINPRQVGYHCTLDCRIRLNSQRDLTGNINALSEIQDVFCLVGTSGDYDLHVWVLIRDVDHLIKIQNDIAGIPDFGKMDVQVTSYFMDRYPGANQYVTTT